MGLVPTKGDIGLEIECEGNKFNKNDAALPKAWCYHQDGSLRGADNAEYVLRQPVKFSEVPKVLSDLWADMAKNGTVLSQSMRTSVHVHLNCQSFHLNRLASFGAIYFACEEILTEWCGDHRVGNLFCLRAKDAPSIISQLRGYIKMDGRWAWSDGLHYAGLNLSALAKFGSLEIRTLRGVTDPSIIQDWVGILQRIYTLSAEYPDPREIIGMFSAEGPLEFLRNILGDYYDTVLAGVEMPEDEIRASLYEGIRFSQDIAYARDWSEYHPMAVTPDPFGRDTKKMAKRLAGMGNGSAPSPELSLSAFDATYSAQIPGEPTQALDEPEPVDVDEAAHWGYDV
jgi:hypothetical protein